MCNSSLDFVFPYSHHDPRIWWLYHCCLTHASGSEERSFGLPCFHCLAFNEVKASNWHAKIENWDTTTWFYDLLVFILYKLFLQIHSQREESYVRLQKHRQLLKEDKHHLVEHEREHSRLIRIGSRTERAAEAYWRTRKKNIQSFHIPTAPQHRPDAVCHVISACVCASDIMQILTYFWLLMHITFTLVFCASVQPLRWRCDDRKFLVKRSTMLSFAYLIHVSSRSYIRFISVDLWT